RRALAVLMRTSKFGRGQRYTEELEDESTDEHGSSRDREHRQRHAIRGRAPLDMEREAYGICSRMSPAQRRYLLLEQGVGAGVVNFAINAAIAWVAFRGMTTVPLWGQQSIAGDTIGTTFLLPFITTLIASRLVRGHVRSGRIAGLAWDSSPLGRWMPRGL